MSDALPYLAVLVGVLLAAAPLMSALTDRQREKALDRYARQVNLALTDAVRPRVVRRILLHERATLLGGGIGAVMALIVGFELPLLPWTAVRDIGPVIIVAVGVALGSTLGTVIISVTSTLRTATGPRIARVTAPELTDYVPRLEQWSAPLSLLGAGLALAGGVIALSTGVLHSDVLDAGDLLGTGGAVLGYAAMISWVLGRLLTRRVLQAGQPAGSEQELAWDDALRSSTLRGLVQLPTALAGCSVVMTFTEVGARTTGQPPVVGIIGVLALLAYLAVAAVVISMDLSARPRQHYWRQLWQPRQAVDAR